MQQCLTEIQGFAALPYLLHLWVKLCTKVAAPSNRWKMALSPENELSNLEVFNLMAVAVLAQLYGEFPISCKIDPGELAQQILGDEFKREKTLGGYVLSPKARRYTDLADHTVAWLETSGFIQFRYEKDSQGIRYDRGWVLTTKGFEALAAVPVILQPPSSDTKTSPSLGERVKDAARALGSQAGKTAISDLIGQVIGAAGRSFLGG